MAKSVASRSAARWLDPSLKGQLLAIPDVEGRLNFLKSQGLIDFFGDSPFVSIKDRITLMAKVGGPSRRSIEVPFYISTGMGGKSDVPERKWYPFFGIGSNKGSDWFIKLDGKRMNSNYGSGVLGQIKELLDTAIGDVDPWYATDKKNTGYDWRKAGNPKVIEEATRRLKNLNGFDASNIDRENAGNQVDQYVDKFVKDIDSSAGTAPRARRKSNVVSPSQALGADADSVSSQLGNKPVMPPASAAADSSEGMDAALSQTLSNIRSRTTGFAGLGPKDPGPAGVTSEQVLDDGTIIKNAYLRGLGGPDAQPEVDPNDPGPARMRVNGKVVEGVGKVRLPNGNVIDLRTNLGRRQFKRVQEALKRARQRQPSDRYQVVNRDGVEIQNVTNRAQGRGFNMGGPVPLLPGSVTPPPPPVPPYPPLNKKTARMSVNPLKPGGFMKYGKMGLGAAGIGLLAGAFIKSKIDERRADEKRQLLLQKQARDDLIGLMGRREYKQSLEADIQRNLQNLQMKAPDLYMRVAAGRVLPQGAVVIGGAPRTDLLNELGMAMANGQFSQ